MQTLFFLNFNQDNIIPDLADAFPGDDKLAFPSKETKTFAWTGNDQRCETVGFAVEFHINGTTKASAGADVDDFFLL